MPQVIVCIAWFTRAGYAAHRAAAPTLPLRFEQWQKRAQAFHKQQERAGRVVRRVMVDIEDLSAWCQREGRDINPRNRADYAAWKGSLN